MRAMTVAAAVACIAGLTIAGCGGGARTDVRHHLAQGALGPYSGAVESRGLLFLSGKVAPAQHRGGPFAAEVHAAIDEVESQLRAAGGSLRDLVHVTVYLTDLDNYAAFNEIYAARLPQPFPARAVVEVSQLPGGAQVEIAGISTR